MLTMTILSSLLVSMSFIGASVKEAYVTLLDLSVVLQMISYLYLYATLAKVAFSKTAGDGFLWKARLRFAAIGGLAATVVGGAVAFVPPRQVDSVWRFELKMVCNCAGSWAGGGAVLVLLAPPRGIIPHNHGYRIHQPGHRRDPAGLRAALGRGARAKAGARLRHISDYRKTSFAQRAQWLHNAARILEDSKQEYGRIMTARDGQDAQIRRRRSREVRLGCRYYAENGERHLADEVIATNASRSFVRYQPIGPVLAVMPWNFPFWQVFRFAAPALMAGNVGLLKHSSNVPQCALAIEDILRRAGFPDGAFQTLLIGAGQTASVLADDRVAAATLTGSEPAGRAVAAQCGDRIKKTVLELGGSDPFIVMPSADLGRSRFDGGEGAHHQQRTVLHRGQALHRRRWHLRRIRAALRRDHEGVEGRRSHGGRDGRRPAGDQRHPRRVARAGGARRGLRSAPAAGRTHDRRPRLLLRAHGAGRRAAPIGRLSAKSCSARWPCCSA
jgi:hypothetical protein